MDLRRTWKTTIVLLALVGMLLPTQVLTAATGPASVASPGIGKDVALSADGILRGQVVSAQGKALAGVCVTASDGNRSVATTVTGADGRFQLHGLKGGPMSISAGQAHFVCRVWTPEVAPPAAQGDVLLVADQGQVLGQGGWRKVVTNPWFIAGVVAAAVAIPVGIHNYNDDDDDKPSSP